MNPLDSLPWPLLLTLYAVGSGLVFGLAGYCYLFIHHPRLWNADDFFGMLLVQRTLYIGGRKGGGKTSLAALLAAQLYAEGHADAIHANIPSVLAEPVGVPVDRAAFIIDEAQRFLKKSQAASDAEAFLRKYKMWLIMPGVGAPHRLLTALWCQRVFNAYRLAIPAWVYRWRWSMNGETEKGWFVVLRPDLLFWSYDTEVVPPDDGGLFDALAQTTAIYEEIERRRLAAQYGLIEEEIEDEAATHRGGEDSESQDAPENRGGDRGGRKAEELTEALMDAAEAFADSAATIEESARTIKSARRRR